MLDASSDLRIDLSLPFLRRGARTEYVHGGTLCPRLEQFHGIARWEPGAVQADELGEVCRLSFKEVCRAYFLERGVKRDVSAVVDLAQVGGGGGASIRD